MCPPLNDGRCTASILLIASLEGEVRGFGEAERPRREPSRSAEGAEGDGL